MARAHGRIAGILLALAMLGTIQPAAAQGFGVGSVVTSNGLTFTVTGCSLKLGGVNQSSCNILNAAMVVSGTTSAPILTIDTTGGTSLFSSTTSISGANTSNSHPNWTGTVSEGAGLDSLNVTISVSAGSRHLIQSIGAGLTGSVAPKSGSCTSSCATYLNHIALADTITGATGSHNITGLNLSQLPSGKYSGTVNGYACSTQTAPCTFTGTHSLSVQQSISLSPNSGYVLTLSNVAHTFGVVPEPLSVALLSVGLVGLAVVRHRRRIG